MTRRLLAIVSASLSVLLLGMPANSGEPKNDTPAVAAERKKIVGMWAMTAPGDKKVIVVFHFHDDGTCSVLNANYQLSWRNKYAFDPTANPKRLDHPNSGGDLAPGIYELDGDTMKYCIGLSERPKDFNSGRLVTLRRVTKKPEEKGK